MARKAYSDEERAKVKEALMTTMIQCIADRGLIHSSIDVLCRKVEISKTFFYSFFSSKEELVLYALRYQQPKLLDYARSLMEEMCIRDRYEHTGNCTDRGSVPLCGICAVWTLAGKKMGYRSQGGDTRSCLLYTSILRR